MAQGDRVTTAPTFLARLVAGFIVVVAAAAGTALAQGDAVGVARHLNAGFAQRRSGDVAGAIRSFEQAVQADSALAVARFELAYALVAAGRRQEAVTHFERGLRSDSSNADAFRQLGYLHADAGRLEASLAAFDAAGVRGTLQARDRLQVGYVHARRGDEAAARHAFAQAAAGDDSAAVAAARAALALPRSNVAPEAGRVRFAELYAAPFYQTRFSNAIAQAVGRSGVVLTERARVSPYVSVRVSRDTRSTGGLQPVIYSDNVVVPAAGIRAQPLRGIDDALQLYAEGGPAIPLVDAGTGRRAAVDVRAGGYYNRQWRAGGAAAADRTPLALVTELYVDASYYSRFDHDVIAFAQLRESLRVLDVNGRGLDLFARLWTVADADRVFYNNAVEAGGGITLFPERRRRIVLMLEHVRGTYLIRPGAATDRRYHDTRATLVVSDFRSWR
jgi:tetratricopeptide (TPR) repeat protein